MGMEKSILALPTLQHPESPEYESMSQCQHTSSINKFRTVILTLFEVDIGLNKKSNRKAPLAAYTFLLLAV